MQSRCLHRDVWSVGASDGRTRNQEDGERGFIAMPKARGGSLGATSSTPSLCYGSSIGERKAGLGIWGLKQGKRGKKGKQKKGRRRSEAWGGFRKNKASFVGKNILLI